MKWNSIIKGKPGLVKNVYFEFNVTTNLKKE